MSGIRTGIFQNEQEYYQALTGWARELLASYALTHVKTSDGGLLRKNGGILVCFRRRISDLVSGLPRKAFRRYAAADRRGRRRRASNLASGKRGRI